VWNFISDVKGGARTEVVRCEVLTALAIKNAVFWDVTTQFVPHRRHYVSATLLSRLMPSKIRGFHGGDYEEWHLLGYKSPVRTSQETHYVSATELSQLMLCKIQGFPGGDYEGCCLLGYINPEEWCLLGYYDVWLL
jgi:hypothetical protein